MKKLRVFQTVKHRRIVSGFSFRNPGTVLLFLLFLLFLPYLLTLCFGNIGKETDETAERIEERLRESRVCVYNETAVGVEKIPLEMYVADKLSRSIDGSYEMEALKAQAVLIRSEIYAEKGENEDIFLADEDYGSGTLSENFQQAAAETGGICLTYQEEAVSGAYFAVSNGSTRDAGDLGLTEYPYLESVLCGRDFLSPDYSHTAAFYEGEFERIWEQCQKEVIEEEELLKKEGVKEEAAECGAVLYRDRAGYVLYVKRNEEFVPGEQMRAEYGLPSADFQIKKENHKILFLVHGKGHGIGMSQFAANEMAKKGEDYTEILNYFFKEATISKFE